MCNKKQMKDIGDISTKNLISTGQLHIFFGIDIHATIQFWGIEQIFITTNE